MILIGQYDSPYVRRVGIALTLYDLPFEHRPWSVFGDAEQVRAYNPLIRVPTLVLDGGDVLIDSHIILDYLDSLFPEARRLFPGTEPDRHRVLKVATLAMGLADKAVSLFYEKRLHEHVSAAWTERCRIQIGTVLDALEQDRAVRPDTYWFGRTIGHADVAVGVAMRFLADAHPGLVDMSAFPRLRAFAAHLEDLPVFQLIAQPFVAPA